MMGKFQKKTMGESVEEVESIDESSDRRAIYRPSQSDLNKWVKLYKFVFQKSPDMRGDVPISQKEFKDELKWLENAAKKSDKKEEFESIDELNKKTLQSYINKASGQRVASAAAIANINTADKPKFKKASDAVSYADRLFGNVQAARKTLRKRGKGIDTAVRKIGRMSEDSEQVDELKKDIK
jgi:hypothetical protein